ncbi:MAG: SdrD B-like domain-containing protein [Dehalococcoidia bacterium]
MTLSDCQGCGVTQGPASKSGVKFEDLNGNGIKEGGEPLLPDWTINLYEDNQPQNGDLDAAEFAGGADQTDTTDAVGFYEFPSLPPGSYIVCEELKTGWVQTFPSGAPAECDGHAGLAPEGYAITLVADEHDTGNDFGNFELGTKSGIKYEDVDGDGDLADGVPLPDWTINLYNDDGTTAGSFDAGDTLNTSDTTDATGKYEFTGLGAGVYHVVEVCEAGWIQTVPTPTSATEADCGTGIYTITVTSGFAEDNNDFETTSPGARQLLRPLCTSSPATPWLLWAPRWRSTVCCTTWPQSQ